MAAAATLAPAGAAQCATTWNPTSGAPGFNGAVNVLANVDLGAGPELYAGGSFTQVGITPIGRIARLGPGGWESLGAGLNGGNVNAIVGWDDGAGPDLYAGGTFSVAGSGVATRVARWNGATWSPLSLGVNGPVRSMVVWNDGSGEALFVGGAFTSAGFAIANRVARWNGAAWSTLSTGTNDTVTALAVYDEGSGPRLFATGLFTAAGGQEMSRIARWNGVQWTRLLEGLGGSADSLAVHDDGTGEALYVSGSFGTAGSINAGRVARWRAGAWSSVGAGLSNPASTLLTGDLGAGPRLFAAGAFLNSGGQPLRFVGQWNGATWSGFSPEVNTTAIALATRIDSGAPALFVGGLFTSVGGTPVGRVARLGCAKGIEFVPGCGGNTAKLIAGPQSPTPNGATAFRLVPSTIAPGLGFLFIGPAGGPCGVPLLGLGELLVDLNVNVRIDLGFFASEVVVPVTFPNLPALIGTPLRAQAIALGLMPVLPPPVEFSTAIDFVVAP